MENNDPTPKRRRKRKAQRIGDKKRFFKRKVKFLNLRYWELFIFVMATSVIIVGVFRNVITSSIYDIIGWK